MRRIVTLVAAVCLSVLLFSFIWVFFFEDHILAELTLGGPQETTAQHWMFILTAAAFSALAFIVPVLLLYRAEGARTSAETENRHLAAAMQHTADSIVLLNAEGIIEYVNPAHEGFTGQSSEELVGKKLSDSISVEHSTEAYAAMRASMARGKIWSGVVRAERRKGKITDEELTISPVKDRSGKIMYYVTVTRDVTKRLNLERTILRKEQVGQIVNKMLKLSLQEMPLKTLLETALKVILSAPFAKLKNMGGIFLVDEQDPVLNLVAQSNLHVNNQSMCKRVRFGQCLCGRAAETKRLIYANCVDERHEIHFDGMAAHGHYNVPIVAKDKLLGVIVLYLPHGHPRSEEDTEFLTAVADTLAGIIERKLGEDERDRLIQAMEYASDGIAITDTERVYRYVNPAFETMTGYSREEAVGQTPAMILGSGGHDDDFYEDLWSTIGNGQVWSGRLQTSKKNGTTYDEMLTISPIEDSNSGEITGYVSIARDITEQLQLEQQLVQSQKLESIGQLAAGIAHEINTPTQYVGDNTRFAKDAFDDIGTLFDTLIELQASASGFVSTQALGDALERADVEYLKEEIPQALEQSLEGVARVAKIVRAMKEFSHPSQEKTPVDLNGAIQSTITVASNEWKYVAELNTDLDPQLPLVTCLPGEFNQVILNIIVNAAHAIADVLDEASGDKGVITVTTRKVDNWAEIRIADTGSGMPEDVKARIFDPFFTTKEVGRGTGQGLSIAYNVVVEKHRGTIEADSKPGQGTCFIIRLPLEDLS